MILDSSAILAIVLKEPGFEILLEKIASAADLSIGAPTLTETGIVLESRIGGNAPGLIVQFLHEWRIGIIPFAEVHWRDAVNAYSRYGKGKHRASLNFGDCLTYAVAQSIRQPLLCTGDDFSRTDLTIA